MKRLFSWKIWRWILLATVVIIFVFIHFLAPQMIVGKRPLKSGYLSVQDFKLDVDTITVKSNDGFNQYAIWCKSNIDTIKGTILMIHGIGSCKDHFLAKAEWLADNGFQSLLIDLRTHGMSEGEYITYGYYESNDIQLFVDEITNKYKTGKIGIWGQSLGAAISLQVLSKDKRIEFGIVESTYCTFDEVVHDYSKRIFGIPLGWINDYVIWRSQSIADFDKTNIHPENACKVLNQPILLVHGTNDDRINVSCANRNFEALSSSQKELLLIEGANHINVWEIGGTNYETKCLDFINQAYALDK
ncbi:MAG: alpha/beta fold hydrolase [Flavobacteriales bacterium]|nr:alpha/beta fold hydrolase [Flavobacteriales bacterium]